MTNTKINQLLLPILFAILLSISGKLSIGKTVNAVFNTILTPVHTPISFLRQNVESQITFIKSLPQIRQQNKSLVLRNAQLLSENEQMKQAVADSKTSVGDTNFKSVLPVRLTGAIGNNAVSSSLPYDKVKRGQPLVYGKILIGTVSEIKGAVINITPLNSEKIETFSIHTQSGQRGQYKYNSNTSQLVDIPSLAPITLGEYVFTEPSELIPGNLIVGKVVKIISGQQEPLQKAQIKLEINFRDLTDGLAIVLEP